MSLLRADAPSFAFEELNHSLTALSTIPISIPVSILGTEEQGPASATIEKCLRDLSTSKPITRRKLEGHLEALQKVTGDAALTSKATPLDKVREAQIMARAVTVIWRETFEIVSEGALSLEEELDWWEALLMSRTNIALYFVQSLPLRLFALIPKPLSFSSLQIPSLRNLHASQLFKQARPKNALSSLRDLPLPAHSPLTLTRREVLTSTKALRKARDEAAGKIGYLASQAPRWEDEAGRTSSEDNLQAIVAETARLFTVVSNVLDLPTPPPQTNNSLPATPISSKRSRNANSNRSTATASPPPPFSPSAATLLPILRQTLPSSLSQLRSPLTEHSRPSRLTRLWIPLLMLPPLLRYTNRTARDNQDWIRDQLRNAGETARGWVVGWVIQPLEGVFNTLRRGGEGLGVAPETVKSDQHSLERMVVDLGRDYYHLPDDKLTELAEKIRAGNMDDVLKVYESEMKSPLKNAIMGNLIRTLLIQVQKTKYDLSLSLLSLDHLLRSQQLTFAFVGLAPSLLILYGIVGWGRRVWAGERRGGGRRMGYVKGVRNIEKLILLANKGEQEMSDRDRGLLILSVGKMRHWAAGLRGVNREAFIDDLRLLETPHIGRNDKLRVVERIWRGWGADGRKSLAS